MTLAEFFETSTITKADFAAKLGVSPVTITRYLNDTRFPDKETILRIDSLTGGRVRPADWFASEKRIESPERAA
jgi:transcriptional regulator with XRE-family HTH domain